MTAPEDFQPVTPFQVFQQMRLSRIDGAIGVLAEKLDRLIEKDRKNEDLKTENEELKTRLGFMEGQYEAARDAETRIDKALKLHHEFKIYDECSHDHHYSDAGTLPDGVVDIDEIGLTCQGGYQYSICSHCCTGGSQEWQTETCANQHRHADDAPCWPCPTRTALT